MTYKKKLEGIRKAIKQVIDYPPADHPRRTEDGYPTEFVYDEFAYKRMIYSVRNALKQILDDFKD